MGSHIYFIHSDVYMTVSISQFAASSPLSTLGVLMFVPNICGSALQIRSSIPFFLDSTYMH